MALSSCFGIGFTQGQLHSFKRTVSQACRKMTARQILYVADGLHEIIRQQSAGSGALNAAIYERSAEPTDQVIAP